jgi:hypothetical protein
MPYREIIAVFILFLVSFYSHLPAYEDGTECSETSAFKLQTPGNYPKECIQHIEHGECLKSRIAVCSRIHTNTLCGHNVELLNVKPGSIYSSHQRGETKGGPRFHVT